MKRIWSEIRLNKPKERLVNRLRRRFLKAGEQTNEPKERVIPFVTNPNQLPLLSQGHTRFVFPSNFPPHRIREICRNGLECGQYRQLTKVAVSFTNPHEVVYTSKRLGYERPEFTIVIDMPNAVAIVQKDSRTALEAIPPKYIVGIIERGKNKKSF